MNPSYEYMRRIRLEEQAKLLDMRRERVVKALDGLTLHGDASAMLTQIAYSVHPHVGAWDAESCDHLRNVLKELIGDAREAASGVESHSPCGTSGCHSGDESAEVGYPFAQYGVLGNERHKAVCELRKLRERNVHTWEVEIYIALGLGLDASNEDLCDRLIYLLDGDQSDGSSPMRQENETGITDELREWVLRRETVEDILMSMPPQTQRRLTYKGNRLLEMADDIDGRMEAMAHDVEMWHDRAEDMRMERDDAERERDMLEAKLGELDASGATELYKLLKKTLGDAKQVADKLNAHNGMLKESERLRNENAKRAADAINKAHMYLDLLRDAARDYKVLQDKLNHVVEVCQSYAEARDA